MKKILLLLLSLLLLLNCLWAQNENNHWFFGAGCGLTFSPTTTAIPGNLNTLEGCATISDKSGNLLFYTDGITVYNRNGVIMTNGTGLLGHPSSTSSALIVPKPESKTDYFIFTVDYNLGTDGINYSIVDMDDDGDCEITATDLGEVKLTTKNISLPGPTGERICVVKKKNDIDYWIITLEGGTNNFYVYELTNQGLNHTPNIQAIGSPLSIGFYMKASPNRTKIGLTNLSTKEVFLYDFNNSTGQISNQRLVGVTPVVPYGVEFSPDNKKMYYSDFASGNGTGTGIIFEVDIFPTLGTPIQIATIPNVGGRYACGALQLTPEDPPRILIAKDGENFLAAINNPNVGGAANFEANAVALTGTCKLGLPTFISGKLEISPACEPCYEAEINNIEICLEINGDSDHPLASLDCDEGGVINIIECTALGNPMEPSDDCANALSASVDVCALINGNPDHPLAYQDCDNGGVPNWYECLHSGNLGDPSDDCTVAENGALNICAFIAYKADHALATLDCDNGGVNNYQECMNGMNPSVPTDDCTSALRGKLDLCAIINGDPNHPLASLDCDNGGVSNIDECTAQGNPSDAEDDCANALIAGSNLCALINNNPDHPLANLDCDAGGVPNWYECLNAGDPTDSIDDCTVAKNGSLNICEFIAYKSAHVLATLDCDNGGIDNFTECMTGMDANVPSDDCTAAVRAKVDICAMINGDPNHPWASLDCDRGGILNIMECNNGADPTEPSDDLFCPPNLCAEAIVGNIDICDELSTDPNHPIGTLDCDGDGVTNADECADSTDPLDPCDFEDTSITLPVTADQSDCPFPCPDLTPIVTIIPGNLAGYSPLEVAVKINEIDSVDTNGSIIIVRMPSDPRLVFVWDIGLTLAALVPVQNADWNYLGDNGIVHTWTYNGPGLIINAKSSSAFGFQSFYNPQSTNGQTTLTATIIPFGGGECNILNNTDSERMVYFE